MNYELARAHLEQIVQAISQAITHCPEQDLLHQAMDDTHYVLALLPDKP